MARTELEGGTCHGYMLGVQVHIASGSIGGFSPESPHPTVDGGNLAPPHIAYTYTPIITIFEGS